MPTTQKILVVDDDVDIVRTLRAYLEESSYAVVTAHDGVEALQAFKTEKPDLVLLDVMMPQIDGLEVTRTIRQESDAPIIMFTARVDETDKVIGLELGADDYITKPFSPREVLARVKAVLRRSKGGQGKVSNVLKAGALALDKTSRTVTLADDNIDLTRSEFNLLQVIMEEPGRVFTRLQLIESGFGYTYEGFERTIDAHIKNLRQKLETDPRNPDYVVTVYGVGYKFNEP